MHITILAHGSRGDVQPYVALGLGLKEAGHAVRIAAPELFRAFVAGYGLEFAPLAGDPRILMQSAVEQAGGRSGLLRAAPVVLKFATSVALQVIQDARQACQGTEAIIHSLLTTTVGHEIALQMGIPDFSALVFAVFSRTAAFPNPGFPDYRLGSWYNRLTHELLMQTYWHGGRLAYNWVTRGKRDQYPPLSGWPFAASNRRITPILYGFSPSVIPKPPDWGEHTHVPGFWFLPAQAPGPPELARFPGGRFPSRVYQLWERHHAGRRTADRAGIGGPGSIRPTRRARNRMGRPDRGRSAGAGLCRRVGAL